MSAPRPTLHSLFLAAVERAPARPFVHTATTLLTYEEAARHVAGILAAIDAAGVSAGATVLLAEDDVVSSVLWSLALAAAGIRFVHLPPGERVEAHRTLAAQVGARAVYTTRPERLPLPLPLLGYDERALPTAAAARARLEAEAARRGDDTILCLQHTSGTTGPPKLLVRDHRTFTRTGAILAETAAAGEPERLLLTSVASRGLGQFVVAGALHLAATLVVPEGAPAELRPAAIRAVDPTYIMLAPGTMSALAQQHAREGRADEPLFGPGARVLHLGTGSRFLRQAQLVAALEQQGLQIYSSYGSAEMSPFIAMTGRGPWHWRRSAGRLLPDVEARVGANDELEVRCPGMMRGYLDWQGDVPIYTLDGFYRTGDCVELSGERDVRLLGRVTDRFRTSDGVIVDPSLAEEALDLHAPWAVQTVVVGDERSFPIALLFVDVEDAPRLPADGYLAPAQFAPLYHSARAALAQVNALVPTAQRVRRWALFGKRLPTELHRTLPTLNKRNSNRTGIARLLGSRLDALYAGTDGEGEPG